MEHLREILKTREINISGDTNFSLRNYSDFSVGTQSIRQLCQGAVSDIITHLSITDKAKISAYTEGRAMNIGKGFGLNMIPGVESTVKIIDDTNISIDMLLYFSDKLLKDTKFIRDIRDAIEMGKENGGTDLSDILYLRNRYDIASIIVNPFEENMSEMKRKSFYDMIISYFKTSSIQGKTSEIDVRTFIEAMVNKGEIDGFYSNQKANNVLPNGFEVPLFIGTDEKTYNFGVTSSIENRDFEILSRKGDLGIMIGRFNPPQIGHIRVIKKALRENGKLFLFLGSANVINDENPFSVIERLFFLNFYFKEEIKSGALTIGTLDDVGDFEKWVGILGEKIGEKFPEFKGKVNIYGGDMKNDRAINAINEYQDSLGLKNVAYREIEREDFFINHNGKKIQVSATAVRDALSQGDYDLAKKLMVNEIGDLVIHKWKEKNELLEGKKLFFIYTPELDKNGRPHRNFKKSEKIKKQVEADFNQNNIVSNVNDSDMIVVVGGDGSLLWAIKEYSYLGKPFYPVAAGTKNFIPSDFVHPYQILTEENEVLEFPLLDVKFYDDKGKIISQEVALNDVYLNVESGTEGTLIIEGDDYPSRVVQGDGLIVSTPIGSTAYTRNAGGNVLPLNNDVLSITDIASSKNISHTVDSNQTITIDVIKGNFTVHADSFETRNVSKIEINKSDEIVKIILPLSDDFRRNRYK